MKPQDVVIQCIDSELEWREAKHRKLEREMQLLRDTRTLFLACPSQGTDNGATGVAQEQKADTVTSQITDAVYQVLLADRPLHRGVIAERLQTMGIYLSGKDEQERVQYLASFLSRDNRFKPVGRENPRRRGEWTLADILAEPIAAQMTVIKLCGESHEQAGLRCVDSDMLLHDDAPDTDHSQYNQGCQ